MRALTSAWSTLVEAWAEFRVYRARVLMSIIGVAVAIMALTAVSAISAVARQSVVEASERSSGRPAMLQFSMPYDGSGTPTTTESAFTDQVHTEMQRYHIRYWSRIGNYSGALAGALSSTQLQLQTADVDYAAMFRVRFLRGSWFQASDAKRFVPAVVIDEGLWQVLGEPELGTHPLLRIATPVATQAIVIGVVSGGSSSYPRAWMLHDDFNRLQTADSAAQTQGGVSYAAWVPPTAAKALMTRIGRDLSASSGAEVSLNRQDYLAYPGPDPLLFVTIVGVAASALILLLGALGLLNISLVTVRARIREIGIRRSFGATGARVFVGVMMESVVATAVAGVVGVMAAILALKNPVVDGLLHRAGLQDIPAFPMSAAAIGFVVAVSVGALAGLLPALVAVRVKPIDAIRY